MRQIHVDFAVLLNLLTARLAHSPKILITCSSDDNFVTAVPFHPYLHYNRRLQETYAPHSDHGRDFDVGQHRFRTVRAKEPIRSDSPRN